jgi:hypothetical protein
VSAGAERQRRHRLRYSNGKLSFRIDIDIGDFAQKFISRGLIKDADLLDPAAREAALEAWIASELKKP